MYRVSRLIRLLVLAMVMLSLPVSQGSAALVRCRVDPIFVLSNGDAVTVTADIHTDPAKVSYVTYILHVPAGVTVRQVVHTALGFGIKEIYKVYQDSPARTYITDTVVTTSNTAPTTAVTVYTRLNGVFVKSLSGYNGQHLIITINRP